MKETYLYKKNLVKKENVLNVGMAYPSSYLYGMSVLGFLTLYRDFDLNENVSAQRFFTDTKFSGTEVKKLDLLGFSCVFEQDIFQILKMFKQYKVKIHAKKRSKNYPLVFIGGPVVTTNPEPFADFFDFMIIGDGEGLADEVVSVINANKNKSRYEKLKALSKITGVYVPALYKPVYSQDAQTRFYPVEDDVPRFINKRVAGNEKCLFSPIISDKTFYANTAFVELVRGCPYACKFCTACWQNKPVRYFSFESIKKSIRKASKYAKKIIFVGAMVSAHPDFDELCIYLKKLKEKRNIKVEFSSLSFDKPAKYVPELLSEKTISLAIECGSEELRLKSGKNLSDKKIIETIQYYSDLGIEKINLYFMIGIPGETSSDIDKYTEFSVMLAKKFEHIKFCHVISTFTPKPATPYEREKKLSNGELREYLQRIKNVFKENKIMAFYPQPCVDAFNALISLGDRRLGRFLAYVYSKNFTSENLFKLYKKFMKKHNAGLAPEDKLPHYSKYVYNTKSKELLLPWEFIKF